MVKIPIKRNLDISLDFDVPQSPLKWLFQFNTIDHNKVL